MQARLERFTAEQILAPADTVNVKAHEVRHADVHWHDFYELGYVAEGTAVHRVNGVEHDLRPGSVFLLTPADFHEIRSDSDAPLRCYNVVIDTWLWENKLDEIFAGGSAPMPWGTSGLASLEPDFRRLWAEYRDARHGAAQMVQALLDCILVTLARERMRDPRHEPRSERSTDPHDIRRAVLYVDRHFRDPLSLAGVAAQAHLSPNYFSERFREFTGTSFQTYLQQRRLAFARSLLAATGLGITEVCHAAGFNSLSHFGRAYRNRYGESPSASRNGTGARGPAAPHGPVLRSL